MSEHADLPSLRAAYVAAVDSERRRALGREWIRTLEDQEAEALDRLDRRELEAEIERQEAEEWAGKGFRVALWAVFGRLEARRQKETDEALASAARFAAAQTHLDRIQRRLADTRAALPSPVDPAVPLAALRAALAALEPTEHARVLDLERAAAEAAAQVREHDEAIAALQRARADATVALERLDSARTMGTWDLLGGGIVASMMKRERVREAIEAIGRTGVALDTLRRELADVRTSVVFPSGIEMGSGAWVFDVWWDNIFSDLNMQARINETRAQVATLLEAMAQARLPLDRARTGAVAAADAAAATARNALEGR